MKFQLIVFVAVFFLRMFLPTAAIAQVEDYGEEWGCDVLTDPNSKAPPQRGGRYFTEQGTIRALVVFVQFKDDSTNPNSTIWPPNQPPTYMNDVLDANLSQQSTTGNLTHWMREMSFDKLKIYGDPYFVVTDCTKTWYETNSKDYGHVNKDVLIKLDTTTTIDFADYDNWTFGYYNHSSQPDSIVDWIIMIHREDLASSFHPGNGIASLGGFITVSDTSSSSNFKVQNGAYTIDRLYPGSGTSLEKGCEGRVNRRYSHELGHLLYDGWHPSNDGDGYGMWGLLFSNANLINAYDRHQLRWVDVNDLSITDSLDVSISDFITTGDAYRVELPGHSSEAFYIEFHEDISYFDQFVNYDDADLGLYIYHVNGTGLFPSYDIEAAEGKFNWSNPFWVPNPWGNNTLPVFVQLEPNRNGYDGRNQIPTVNPNGVHKIYLTDNDQDGQYEVNRRVFGSVKDAFRMGKNQLFSPWSNPSSEAWSSSSPGGNVSIQLMDTTVVAGRTIYNLRIRVTNHENGPPANPLLLNLQSYSSGGNDGIKITWAANREPDIAGYEVYRQINSGNITKISGSSLVADTFFVEWGVQIASGPSTHTYYVKAVDTQNKTSNYSNGLNTAVQYVSQGGAKRGADGGETTIIPEIVELAQNFPNPFNPTTTFAFALPEAAPVRLTIFDLNGRQVAQLVNEELPAGRYEIPFDASHLASGVYLYRLSAGQSFSQVRKMMLIK